MPKYPTIKTDTTKKLHSSFPTYISFSFTLLPIHVFSFLYLSFHLFSFLSYLIYIFSSLFPFFFPFLILISFSHLFFFLNQFQYYSFLPSIFIRTYKMLSFLFLFFNLFFNLFFFIFFNWVFCEGLPWDEANRLIPPIYPSITNLTDTYMIASSVSDDRPSHNHCWKCVRAAFGLGGGGYFCCELARLFHMIELKGYVWNTSSPFVAVDTTERELAFHGGIQYTTTDEKGKDALHLSAFFEGAEGCD